MDRMSNEQIKNFALQLLHADSEEDVIGILKSHDFWDNPGYWRLLGDDENNFKIVGAQQSRPEPALVEKLINSVDARLTAACLRAGIDPESPQAPQTISAACKEFFQPASRTELAKGITLSTTGARAKQHGMPSITICDIGEGQSPSDVPGTFMSIDKKNKLRIPFVQGKFNMGGTGALVFCGKHKLQLLITRRDPALASPSGNSDSVESHWSVTIVRRETPEGGPFVVKNPYFKYLAPLESTVRPYNREVLSFSSPSLHLMPEGNKPYTRPIEWGSCIKLYEYDMRGFKGHTLRTDGLLSRLEVLLPEIALPIRVHECREGLKGHAGSFDTNLIGLRARLETSQGDNLEPGYPAPLTLTPQGQPMTAKIYAFKDDKADRYRADQGVVFAINGQTHGWFPKSFFERKRVKMGRLAKSILIVVDCSDLSVGARADLFKNSRDRLSGGDLRRDIEEELEYQIANHPGLRELRERRRKEEVTEKLSDSKPLEHIVGQLIKSSPSLSQLFIMGQRLNAPYRSGSNGHSGGGGAGSERYGKGDFKGHKHPTYFKFDKLKENQTLSKTCELGRRCRFRLETDVENEYFIREVDPGRYHVEVISGPLEGRELTSSANLFNGVANWSVTIPEEDVAKGDVLTIQLSVVDDVMPDPFVNIARITITEKNDRGGTAGSGRKERSIGREKGSGYGNETGNKGKSSDGPPSGIDLPPIHKVKKDGWAQHDFDGYSACTVIEEGIGDEDDDRSVYEFYINVDNIYLQTDMKHGKGDPSMAEARFIYGNVLIGLALLHDQRSKRPTTKDANNDDDDEPLSRTVDRVTRAISPFLVPMIEYLGALDGDTITELAQTGDED